MSNKNSTVLVTGAAGYIGAHVTLALLDRGSRVVALDDLSHGFRELVPADAVFIQGNYGDKDALRRAFAHGPNAVVHTGASISVPESMHLPADYYWNNMARTLPLLHACLRGDVRKFVFSSSSAVYGDQGNLALSESISPAPASPYGASKAMAERMLRDIDAATTLRCVSLRYFNVAGADPAQRAGDLKSGGGGLFKTVLQCAAGTRDVVHVCGTDYSTPDGSALRDYVHVCDVADANIAALDFDGGAGEVFNVGRGTPVSVREVIAAVGHASGQTIKTIDQPRRPGDVPCSFASMTKTRRELGFTPRHTDLQSIATDALRWERRLSGMQNN